MAASAGMNVNPAQMRLHARKLETVANELRSSQAEVHGDVASIAQGFSGTVASGALSELLDHWERQTATGHKDLMGASGNLEANAASFENQEDRNTRRFESGGGQ